MRKHGLKCQCSEWPLGTGYHYGPWQPSPGKRMRRQMGRCPRSNPRPTRMEKLPSDSSSARPVITPAVVTQGCRETQATCVMEPRLRRGGIPETRPLRENESESCTVQPWPCVPTCPHVTHSTGSLASLGLCVALSEADTPHISIGCREKIRPFCVYLAEVVSKSHTQATTAQQLTKKVTRGTCPFMEISLPLCDMKTWDLEVPRMVPKPRMAGKWRHLCTV